MTTRYVGLRAVIGASMLVLIGQTAALVSLRGYWWGWWANASYMTMHASTWGAIASSVVGVWIARVPKAQRFDHLLATSALARGRPALHAVIPAALVLVSGQALFGIAFEVLASSQAGFGRPQWLAFLAAGAWNAMGLVLGFAIGWRAPWKVGWLLAPVSLMLGTQLAVSSRRWPTDALMPTAPSIVPDWQATSLALILPMLTAGLVALGAWGAVVRSKRLLVLPVCALAVAVPATPLLEGLFVKETPGALDYRCAPVEEIEICVPRSFASIESRYLSTMSEAVANHPALLAGVSRILADSMLGDPPGEGSTQEALVVEPAYGHTMSMLGSSTRLQQTLAEQVMITACPLDLDFPLFTPALMRLTVIFAGPEGLDTDAFRADLLAMEPVAEGSGVPESERRDREAYADASAVILDMSEDEFATFVANLRVVPEDCTLSPSEFLRRR